MKSGITFLATSLSTLFIGAQDASAECAYSPAPSSTRVLISHSDQPVLGKQITVIGINEHDRIEALGQMVSVDCVRDQFAFNPNSVSSIPYIFQLEDVAAMMEQETLQLRPRQMEPSDKMHVVAQCGLITIDFDPTYFENDSRSFSEALIHIMGIISTGNYDRSEHRGYYDFFAKKGDNLFSLDLALCIS